VKTLLLFIAIASCARLSSLPPRPETAKLLEKGHLGRPLKLEEVWYSLYANGKKARAEGNSQLACESFGRLSSYEDFPLSSLARLYQLESCAWTGNAFPAQALGDLVDDMPAGFTSELSEVTYALAKKFGEPQVRAKAALALAKERSLRAEKEQLYHEAWQLAPPSDLKAEAEKALFKYAPRFNPSPTKDEFPDVARDFERARDFESAKEWYQLILKENPLVDFDRWIKAANRYRMIFKNQRDKAGFLKETNALKVKLEALVKKKRNEKIIDALADIMIQEARAEWTENNRTKADLILQKALEFLPTMSVNMKALTLWIRGMIALEARDHPLGKSLFRQALALKPSDTKVINDASWNLAWTLYLDHEFTEFISFVDEVKQNLGPELDEKLSFWKGKAQYKMGQIPAALSTWEELYARSPFNFYGLMAHASSGGQFEALSSSLDESPQSEEVEWLAALGEWDLCKSYLDDWRAKKPSDGQKERWLASFVRCRHAAGAIRTYYSHSKSGDPKFMAAHLPALFPLSFKNDVFDAANRFAIDPYLMQSIIRQESAFNPEARSPADAFGLMQLIPELAKRLAKQHKVTYQDFDDLYQPITNVTLGAAYLKELEARMNKRMVGMIAAYNAGTGPINNWYRTRPKKDVFEFIEGIAYEETRNYVKLVLRNWIIYQQLEKNSAFSLDISDLH
tara:strand:- start:5063 stop:7114 length:2052 start_codon:yes stop_codon:yes gene_type:complete